MKKINLILACAAGMAVLASCQKELIEGEQIKGTPVENLVATASIPQVKVSFTQDGTTGNLKGNWEVGDVIFGLKGDSVPVEFSVAQVDATTGVATLTQTTDVAFSNGDEIHVIYCKGKTSTDLNEGTLAIDFSSQSKENLPVVMLADATVSEGAVNFQFTNAVSIIGIEDPDYSVSDDRAITKLVLSGHEIVSSAKVVPEEGVLTLKNDVPSNFIEYTLSTDEYENEGGTVTFKNPIYLAVPSCKIERATFVDAKRYIKSYLIDKVAAASKYYKIAEKTFESISLPTSSGVKTGGVTWAKMNIGATTASGTGNGAYGDIFQWTNPELYYSAKTNSTITFKSEFSGGFTDYEGHSYYSTSGYTKYNGKDGKTQQDPVDDIVMLMFPGSGWKTPSEADWQSLIDAVSNKTITSSFASSRVTFKDEAENSFNILRQKTGAKETAYSETGKLWTSTIYPNANSDNYNEAKQVSIANTTGTLSIGHNYRTRGLEIRPVRESASSAE